MDLIKCFFGKQHTKQIPLARTIRIKLHQEPVSDVSVNKLWLSECVGVCWGVHNMQMRMDAGVGCSGMNQTHLLDSRRRTKYSENFLI